MFAGPKVVCFKLSRPSGAFLLPGATFVQFAIEDDDEQPHNSDIGLQVGLGAVAFFGLFLTVLYFTMRYFRKRRQLPIQRAVESSASLDVVLTILEDLW